MADQSNYNMDYGALAQAGAQILGASMNAAVAAQTSERDRKFNTRVRAENRKWALEDYARMLEDSSPKKQVERLKAGGLNPNLVYGSGNIQTGVVSQPREATMPDSHVRPFQLDLAALNVLGTVLGAQLQKAQIRKTEAEADKATADAEKATEETKGIVVSNDILTATSEALKEKPYLENQLTQANISNVQQSTALITAKIKMTEEQTNLLVQQQLEIAEQIKLIQAKTDLTIEQIQTEVAKQVEARAHASYLNAQKALIPSMIAMYNSSARLNNSNAEFNEKTMLTRQAILNNQCSNLVKEFDLMNSEQKVNEATVTQKQVSTGSEIADGLLQIGDIMLDVYNSKTRRLQATRGRRRSVTSYDRNGNVTGGFISIDE